MDDIVVSIICNTFNHSKYIEQTIQSFIMQSTDFKYEVLIHDDASTDGTAEIIEKYAQENPQLIKPILQTTNQYSKGINISKTFQYPRVKGKYIALCEGDDYWSDPYKLQKQVEILDRHPELDICAHAVKRIDDISGVEMIISPREIDEIIEPQFVISGGGAFVGTNSLMYRSNLLRNLPKFLLIYPIDYTFQVYGALRGGMYFISDVMSVYRFQTPTSWTRNFHMNKEKVKASNCRWIKMLQQMDQDTGGIYKQEIERLILLDGISLNNTKAENLDILHEYQSAFQTLSKIEATRVLGITYLPKISLYIKERRMGKRE